MSAGSSFLVAERDPLLRQTLAEITAEHFPGAAIFPARDEAEAIATLPRLRPPCVAENVANARAAGTRAELNLNASRIPTSPAPPITIVSAISVKEKVPENG